MICFSELHILDNLQLKIKLYIRLYKCACRNQAVEQFKERKGKDIIYSRLSMMQVRFGYILQWWRPAQ